MFSITTYISTMYSPNGGWYPPEIHQSEDLYGFQTASKFAGSISTAVELLKANSYVEARRLLSGACALVRDLLLHSHPATLGYVLLMFYNISRERLATLDDAAELLRQYIGRMAAVVLPENNPWRAIWWILGNVDKNVLRQTVVLAMRSSSDMMCEKLGWYNKYALSNRVRYIFYGYAENLPAGEVALRKLLAGCPPPEESYDQIIAVLGALTGNLREQGRYEEYEEMGKEYLRIARAYGDSVAVVNGLRITAMAQYRLGDTEGAERNQREAVDMNLADESESFNLTWAIQHLKVLEGWVREWGRHGDADKMKEEVDRLIKRDTTDVEDDIV